ncbi:autotransporter domain-containing protein [Porticoccus sp. W117]|uniref:autotransporter domain-containing protein n=1 Tax=Porticoccus sp. W117 TaxID=3054777 RepID=UPI002597443E|nr:autotransporter outer membrane beta-barrel domain-containing protein [Porticoccus sp. W117]MDM3870001.1 autotransporter domain-containing protein [Porticoccus sp. W117]
MNSQYSQSHPWKASRRFNKLALNSAIVAALFGGGYGRVAYAGSTSGSSPNFTASGPANSTTDVTQTLSGTDLTVTTLDGFGIDTSATGGSSAFVLNSTGSLTFFDEFLSTIRGAANGIDATNNGSGALTITTTGQVSGLNGIAISALGNASSSDLILNVNSVIGGTVGIDASHRGTGQLTITATGELVGLNGGGIDASLSNGTDLLIDVANVTGAEAGINATHSGTGQLNISAGNVEGDLNAGIFASLQPSGAGQGTDLIISANDVTSNSGHGIHAEHYGGGELNITTTGSVVGRRSGILVDNYGGGALSINAVDVRGVQSTGISINGSYSTGGINVTSTGHVHGRLDGVGIADGGQGDFTVNVVDATGDLRSGIRLYGDGATGNISVTSTGEVRGGRTGIEIEREAGSGDISVTANNVYGLSEAIDVKTYDSSGDIEITTTGSVAGTRGGISVYRYNGSGDVTINAHDATAVVDGSGIDLFTYTGGAELSGDASITVTGTASGVLFGVNAEHNRTGDLSIHVNDATATQVDGITATNRGADLSITATGTVTGGSLGRAIYAEQLGTGNLVISANNLVATPGGGTDANDGIYARNENGVDTRITVTGRVESDGDGINADHRGSGDLVIVANELIANPTTDLIRYKGVDAHNTGGGDTHITVTGLIHAGGEGVGVDHNNVSGNLTLEVNDIIAGPGTGGDRNDGIDAVVRGGNSTIKVNGHIQAGDDGIDAGHFGSGELAITVNRITADAHAINTYFSNQSTDMSVTSTGALTAGANGLNISHRGSGTLNIDVADITADSDNSGDGDAIAITTSSSVSDITINASGRLSGQSGVQLTNAGTGATSVTVNHVDAASGDAVRLVNDASASIMAVTATGLLSAAEDGLDLSHSGSGALNVNVVDITADSDNSGDGDAIAITTTSTVSDITISASGRLSGQSGVQLTNAGTGATSVTVNHVDAASGDAVRLVNDATASIMAVTATGLLTAAEDGLDLSQSGSGALNVNVVDIVADSDNSGDGDAIAITTTSTVSDITINASGRLSGQSGVQLTNAGTGATSVTVNHVDAASGDAVHLVNDATASIMAVTVNGAITAGDDGLDLRNSGTGPTIITVAAGADVRGTNLAIRTNGDNIASADTLNVAGTINGSVDLGGGNDQLNVQSTGAILGDVQLGEGVNTVEIAGDVTGNLTAGAGADAVTLSGGQFTGNINLGAGDNRVEIQSAALTQGDITLGAGSDTVLFSGQATGDVVLDAGNDRFSVQSTGSVTGDVQLGEGVNVVDVAGDIAGNLTAGAGADVITLSGGQFTGNINLGAGDNRVEIQSAALTQGDITLGSGSDTVVFSGQTVGDVLLDAGDDRFSVQSTGSVTGNIQLGEGVNTVDMAGDISGDLTAGSSADVVTLSGGQFIGNINLGAGDNRVEVQSAALIQGDITLGAGSDTVLFAGQTTGGVVLGDGDDQFDLIAGTFMGDIELGTGDDTVNITGGSLNGQITGVGQGVVTIDVGASNDFVSYGVVNVEDYIIRSGKVFQRGNFSTASTTTVVENGATLSFDSAINGSGALVSNGNLEFVVNNANAGQLTQAGTVTLNSGSTITVVTDDLAQLLQSQELISASSIIDNGVTLLADDNFLFDLSLSNTGGSLSVVSEVVDLGSLSDDSNISQFGNALASLVARGNTNGAVDFLGNLTPGDVNSFEQLLSELSPSVSGAVVHAGMQMNDASMALIGRRVADVFEHESGQINGLWVEAFTDNTQQQAINGVEGFDAHSRGGVLGYDLRIDDWKVGLAFGRGYSDVDNDRLSGERIETESDQLAVYAGYQKHRWHASASLSYSDVEYNLTRQETFLGNGVITGDTNGDLLAVSIGGGYRYELGGLTLTPVAQVHYQALNVDSYTEQGGLNLQLDYADTAMLTSEIGLMGAAPFKIDGWDVAATGHLLWSHEYLSEAERVDVVLASGERFYQQGFSRDKNLLDTRVGVEANNGKGLTLGINLHGRIGSHIDTYGAAAKVEYRF